MESLKSAGDRGIEGQARDSGRKLIVQDSMMATGNADICAFSSYQMMSNKILKMRVRDTFRMF